MKKSILLGTSFVVSAGMAFANDDLIAKMDDPNNWAIQTGDYENQRFSELDQITKENVGDLQVAWTFSTGVLRGHEGSPLVVDAVLYVHTPFPNIVYARDLKHAGRTLCKSHPKQDHNVTMLLCCDPCTRTLASGDGKL